MYFLKVKNQMLSRYHTRNLSASRTSKQAETSASFNRYEKLTEKDELQVHKSEYLSAEFLRNGTFPENNPGNNAEGIRRKGSENRWRVTRKTCRQSFLETAFRTSTTLRGMTIALFFICIDPLRKSRQG